MLPSRCRAGTGIHFCGWTIAFMLPSRCRAGTGITPADGRSPSGSGPGALLEPVSFLRMDDCLHAPAPVSCWNRCYSCGWTIAFTLPSRCRAGTSITPADG
ncbi:MAG TPA: hypothetical protein PLN56_06540 [Methanoregulaceae archaeon]|nr:MAG: hypothetical protein IPI71_09795 [Methanolinea sp.]HPD10636.1 hypothetical protein [Methanoregulaceae archaeon]HRT15767.1 hypothetical protein [Methanoregulaceae archaeon]HRU31281.1 hypothetical protein [Methanoregulaceae archaeon]